MRNSYTCLHERRSLTTVPGNSAGYGCEWVSIVVRMHKRQENRHRGFWIFGTIGFTAWCQSSGNFKMAFRSCLKIGIKPWTNGSKNSKASVFVLPFVWNSPKSLGAKCTGRQCFFVIALLPVCFLTRSHVATSSKRSPFIYLSHKMSAIASLSLAAIYQQSSTLLGQKKLPRRAERFSQHPPFCNPRNSHTLTRFINWRFRPFLNYPFSKLDRVLNSIV